MSALDNAVLGVLTTSYPSITDAGPGSFVRDFARAAAGAGHAVEVLCPEPEGKSPPVDDPGVSVQQLSYFRPRAAQFLSRLPGAPEGLARAPALWAPAVAYAARLTAALLLRRRRYTALVSHWLVPSALAGGLACDLPHLAIAHGSDVRLLERLPGGAGVARWLVQQGTYFAFVSQELAQRFAALLTAAQREQLNRRAVVQPMGVHSAELVGEAPSVVRARLGLRGPTALWLGRYTRQKHPERMLELAESLPELTVLLAGAGPEEAALKERARLLGSRVRFFGWADSELRRALLAAADLLVITSGAGPRGGEGAPMVAREGLAAGLPVVATRVGGLADLEGLHAPVRLVPDGDAEGLVAACRAALDTGRPDPVWQALYTPQLDWQQVLPRLLAPLGL